MPKRLRHSLSTYVRVPNPRRQRAVYGKLSVLVPALLSMLFMVPLDARSAEGDRVPELLKLLPDSTNVLAIVRAEQILDLPRAERDGWSREQAAGLLVDAGLPAWSPLVLIGSQSRPDQLGDVWSLGLVPLSQRVDLERIASRENGAVTTVANRSQLLLPQGTSLVLVRPDVLAATQPVVRQEIARWIRSTEGVDQPRVSPFLQESATDSSHIVLAVDLEDMLDPVRVNQRLMLSPAVRQAIPTARTRFAELVPALQGLHVSVQLDTNNLASLKLTFRRDVGGLQDLVKEFLLELMAELGANVPEMEVAQVSSQGHQVRLDFVLSDESLRRLMTLILIPRIPELKPSSEPEPLATEQNRQPQSPRSAKAGPDGRQSKRYFDAIAKILDSLDPARRRSGGTDYLKTATWHDNYAKRIDQLSTNGVDPELVQFGADCSSRLRALAASLRGVAVKVDAQQRSVTYSYQVDPGMAGASIWGGAIARPGSINWNSNLADVRSRQAQAVADGAQERESIWLLMRNDRATIERKMNARYGDQFKSGGRSLIR